MMLMEGRRDVGIILLLVKPKTHLIVYSSCVAFNLNSSILSNGRKELLKHLTSKNYSLFYTYHPSPGK